MMAYHDTENVRELEDAIEGLSQESQSKDKLIDALKATIRTQQEKFLSSVILEPTDDLPRGIAGTMRAEYVVRCLHCPTEKRLPGRLSSDVAYAAGWTKEGSKCWRCPACSRRPS